MNFRQRIKYKYLQMNYKPTANKKVNFKLFSELEDILSPPKKDKKEGSDDKKEDKKSST